MSFSLRAYGEADWPELRDLWIESWSLTRPEIDFAARAPWLRDLLARSAEAGAKIVVAEDEQGPIGFVLFDPARQWLEQIAVRPRAFGGGAARALLRQAKQACPQGLGLDVNSDNFRALGFYRSEGFVPTGEGRNPLSGLPIVMLRWTPTGRDPE